jgi:hypothetical protein
VSDPKPAANPNLPSPLPTIVVTLVFGLVGLWPMSVQTRRAARRGVVTERYWYAFLVAVTVNLLMLLALVLTVFLVVRHYLG